MRTATQPRQNAAGDGAFSHGRIPAVYVMARDVWVPDAIRTLARLERALDVHAGREVLRLCAHLRDDSRQLGVRSYAAIADGVESYYCHGDEGHSHQLIETALARSQIIEGWLEHYAYLRSEFESPGAVVDEEA